MGKKIKKISSLEDVALRIKKDLAGGTNVVKKFNTKEIPKEFKDSKIFPQEVIEKSVAGYIATSACSDDDCTYALLTLERIDDNSTVLDMDPSVLIFDATGSNGLSGLSLFHQNFEGRTETIEDSYGDYSMNDIKNMVKTEEIDFSEAPKKIIECMHYVANKYRNNIKK